MLKKNLLYNTLYQILQVVVPIILTPYLSRTLGAEGIGEYSYSYTVAYYFYLFAMLGVSNYGNRCVAMARDNRRTLSKTFWGIYTVQFCVSCVCLAAYFIYAIVWSGSNLSLTLAQSAFVLSGVVDINWLFFGLEKFKVTVTRNSVIKVLSMGLILMFVKSREDVLLYALILGASGVLSNLYLWLLLKKEVNFVRLGWKDIRYHIKPMLVLFIPVIAVSIYKQMDKLMIKNLSNTVQLGYYENCEKVTTMISSFIGAVGTVMLPKSANLIKNGQIELSKKYIRITLRCVVAAAMALVFGICAVSDTFVAAFFGKEFASCGPLLMVLSIVILPQGMANVIRTQYLIPNEKDRIYVVSVGLGAVLNFALNATLIPRMGALGAAWGTVAAELSVMLYQAVRSRKAIPVRFYCSHAWISLVAGVIMFLVVRNVGDFEINQYLLLVIQIITGVVVYLVVHLIGSAIFERAFFDQIKGVIKK